MLAIRLPESVGKRLEKLARRTGRTKTYYVREAILQHLFRTILCVSCHPEGFSFEESWFCSR